MRIPGKKTRPRQYPTRGPSVTAPSWPQASQWEGREMEKLGNMLSRLGGTLANAALNVQKLAIENEVSNATMSFAQQMSAEEPNIMKESPAIWGDSYRKIASKKSKAMTFKTPAAKRSFGRWAAKFVLQEGDKFRDAGMRKVLSNFRAGLSGEMVSYIDRGDLDGFHKRLEVGKELGALVEGEAEIWKRRANVYAVDKIAQDTLEQFGKKAAIKFITSRPKEMLTLKEKDELIKNIITISDNMKIKTGLQQKAVEKEEVTRLLGTLGTPDEWPLPADVKDSTKLGAKERTAWTKISEGIGKGEPKIDYKRFIKLGMKIFDRWRKDDKGKDILLETEIASARYDKRYIDDANFVELTARLALTIAPEYVSVIESAFNEIIKVGARSPSALPGTLPLVGKWLDKKVSQKEAKHIVMAQDSLLKWIIEQISRKKDLSPQDVTVRARELITSIKSRRPKKESATDEPPIIDDISFDELFPDQPSSEEDLSKLSDEELLKRITGSK